MLSISVAAYQYLSSSIFMHNAQPKWKLFFFFFTADTSTCRVLVAYVFE
jgi:hypothetical protein